MESSVENAWEEINNVKSDMDSSQQDTENLKATVKSLKLQRQSWSYKGKGILTLSNIHLVKTLDCFS